MIQVENLQFSYTNQPFIRNMNFSVGRGEVFGFLGPSGAGKSTLQKILTGLATTYEGSVQVNGTEIRDHGPEFYEKIGVDFEFSTCYEKFTAAENLRYFGSLYKGPLRPASELLESVGLAAHSDKKVSAYSKGMKSRLNFIKALLHNPDLLFLDEPTSGLDPVSSRRMKDIIRQEKTRGKTVLLTTHNMYDAAELCDRVAFIVEGKICALDSPRNLIMKRGAARIQYTYQESAKDEEKIEVDPAEMHMREQRGECLIQDTGSDGTLQRLIREGKLLSIHSSEPTLNEIFQEVTGHSLQQI